MGGMGWDAKGAQGKGRGRSRGGVIGRSSRWRAPACVRMRRATFGNVCDPVSASPTPCERARVPHMHVLHTRMHIHGQDTWTCKRMHACMFPLHACLACAATATAAAAAAAPAAAASPHHDIALAHLPAHLPRLPICSSVLSVITKQPLPARRRASVATVQPSKHVLQRCLLPPAAALLLGRMVVEALNGLVRAAGSCRYHVAVACTTAAPVAAAAAAAAAAVAVVTGGGGGLADSAAAAAATAIVSSGAAFCCGGGRPDTAATASWQPPRSAPAATEVRLSMRPRRSHPDAAAQAARVGVGSQRRRREGAGSGTDRPRSLLRAQELRLAMLLLPQVRRHARVLRAHGRWSCGAAECAGAHRGGAEKAAVACAQGDYQGESNRNRVRRWGAKKVWGVVCVVICCDALHFMEAVLTTWDHAMENSWSVHYSNIGIFGKNKHLTVVPGCMCANRPSQQYASAALQGKNAA
eukprot:363989-Chlamydomonas_euryale.AAC.1